MPIWNNEITNSIRSGRKVLIVAHGNSIRSLVQHLDNLSEEQITELNIPTGIPLVYELDHQFKPTKSYYLGDAASLEAAKEKVANQTKK
jgi:2,3-bisphosphoglycerate-dependent phosphoglycerate mutase